MSVFKIERWSPYVIGAGIGVLSWVTFGLMGKALGVSTTLVRWAGMLGSIFGSEQICANPYYAKYLIDKPAVDWQMMLVIGLVFGFLLQRGGVTRYRVIVGQFLMKDHTVLKTMLTAVVVGAVGVWALHLCAGVSPWVFIAALATVAVLLFAAMHRLGKPAGTKIRPVPFICPTGGAPVLWHGDRLA